MPRQRIAGIVLAAGQSARMGENKLLCRYGGQPLIIHAVDAALGAGLDPVCVVTGHERERIVAALQGRAVRFVDNPAFASGMASSLAAGIRALEPDGCGGAVVLLGDMPRVRAEHVAQLVAAFEQAGPEAICACEHAGRRGNPVLWPARDFAVLTTLHGDVGGRAVLDQHAERVLRVAIDDDGVLSDVDSPAALRALTALPPDRALTRLPRDEDRAR